MESIWNKNLMKKDFLKNTFLTSMASAWYLNEMCSEASQKQNRMSEKKSSIKTSKFNSREHVLKASCWGEISLIY